MSLIKHECGHERLREKQKKNIWKKKPFKLIFCIDEKKIKIWFLWSFAFINSWILINAKKIIN